MASDHVYLATKQVPSCLAVKNPGNYSLYKNLGDVLERGFPLLGKRRVEGLWETVQGAGGREKSVISRSSLSFLGGILQENRVYNERVFGDTAYESDIENDSDDTRAFSPLRESTEGELKETYKEFCIAYDNPFLILRARRIAEINGIKKLPQFHVWQGDVLTIKDVLPKRVLGRDYDGKTGTEFHRIAKIDVKMHVIEAKTHWGAYARQMGNSDDEIVKSYARKFLKRLRAFLEGGPDPVWKRGVDPRADANERANPEQRAKRLLDVLCTVDGIFLQRFLSFPEEEWSWEKFDRFTIVNIDALLSDEFLDFRLKDNVFETVVPFYSLLKKMRKGFKGGSHRNNLQEHLDHSYHPWLEQWRPIHEQVERVKGDTPEYLRLVGILSQTRGCGKPPPIVTLQTKKDTLLLLSEPMKPLEKSKRAIISSCVDQVMKDIPEEALTGLGTHAIIRVTTAACWESTVGEGGTANAINNIVWDGTTGRKCKVLDLQTGKVIQWKDFHDCTVGEYIFWRSLEEVLGTEPETLGRVRLVMVEDPGKARTVTKGSACLKVIYDVVNKLCARVITKGIESSRSGMEKSNHAWQMYKMFFNQEHCADSFKIRAKTVLEERHDREQEVVETVYEELFSGNTDYSSATDQFHFEIADMIGTAVMRKVGIPKMLIGIVRRISFQPRKIFFNGDGPLGKIGTPEKGVDGAKEENLRSVMSQRGLLMGDPLTKVILHMVNICVRTFSRDAEKGIFSSHVTNENVFSHAMSNVINGKFRQ